MATIRERIIASGNLPTLPAAAMYILQLANDDSRRIRLIDGARDKESVAEDVWNAVADLLL